METLVIQTINDKLCQCVMSPDIMLLNVIDKLLLQYQIINIHDDAVSFVTVSLAICNCYQHISQVLLIERYSRKLISDNF